MSETQTDAVRFIIEKEMRSFDIGCGDEVNIADALATYRQEPDVAGANEILAEMAFHCAEAVIAASLSREAALVEALQWALPLARQSMEDHRVRRIQAGHTDQVFRFIKDDGSEGIGLTQVEYNFLRRAGDTLAAALAQSQERTSEGAN